MPRTPSAPKRRGRSDLGTVRQLPSRRFQASYRHEGRTFTAPHTFENRTDAAAWLAGERADRARGTWRDPHAGRVNLADYAATWLDSRTNLAPSTRRTYRAGLLRWVLPDLGQGIHLGAMTLDELTPAHVRRWFTRAGELAEQAATSRAAATSATTGTHTHPARAWGRAHGWQVADTGRLSPALLTAWQQATEQEQSRTAGTGRRPGSSSQLGTDAARPGAVAACNAYRVLRALLNAAIRDGLLTANPCTIEGAGIVRHQERTPATPEQVAQLAEAMPTELAPAVLVAAWSGLRFGELFALARRHIDVTHGSIRVERALNRSRQFGPTKTASSVRTVWLPGFVAEALAEHLAQRVGPEPDALLWTSEHGAPIRHAHVSKHYRRAARVIGRDDLRWHDLRHTGATLAYGAGGTVRDVQRRLGHATARAAMIYAHAADNGDQLLAARLDVAYRPSPPPTTPPRPVLALVGTTPPAGASSRTGARQEVRTA